MSCYPAVEACRSNETPTDVFFWTLRSRTIELAFWGDLDLHDQISVGRQIGRLKKVACEVKDRSVELVGFPFLMVLMVVETLKNNEGSHNGIGE